MKNVILTDSVNCENISNIKLNQAQIGDFYWVKYSYSHDDIELEKERLMCINHIGSNYFRFTIYSSSRSSCDIKIHFNDFLNKCRREENWESILNDQIEHTKLAMQCKTQEMIKSGQDLCVIPTDVSTMVEKESDSFLPVIATQSPKEYQNQLVVLKHSLPDLEKEMSELSDEFATASRNLVLPYVFKMEAVKDILGCVDDRIFSLDLYCGIQEDLVKIKSGESAPFDTKISVRQQMLFMDEEALIDYDKGGMDFGSIDKFDEWVVKPNNLNRILPDQRGIVAMKVRRHKKEYGDPRDLSQAIVFAEWHKQDLSTYLLIRNGQNVYRISSQTDFSPRLIPKLNEIGKEQFLKINNRYNWDTHERVRTETLITPESVEYDSHMKHMENLIKQYNRIVIVIQGLLDRSTVFHPHPVINLSRMDDMLKWIELVRDEENVLTSNRLTWEEYRDQLNKTLKPGKWVKIDHDYNEKYEDGCTPSYGDDWRYKMKRGFAVNQMPKIIKVTSVKRDKTAVKVSWPWGQLQNPIKIWQPDPDKPGWGHYDYDYSTNRMCHEWIPVEKVLNISDYTPGDYKLFLCDRSLQGEYLKWAPYLLDAEKWNNERKSVKRE